VTKVEYPQFLLSGPSGFGKLDEVYVEDRFTKTITQPLMCYSDKRVIDSPYRDGAKNLRYASPNYVSNAVFYDQTSNLSLSKSEMYRTTNQSSYTPQKYNIERVSQTIDNRKETGYYSPTRHLLGSTENKPLSARGRSPRSSRADDDVISQISSQKHAGKNGH
jgi:hypothetical protein